MKQIIKIQGTVLHTNYLVIHVAALLAEITMTAYAMAGGAAGSRGSAVPLRRLHQAEYDIV